MNNTLKLVFWDWLGTLITSDYMLDYYLKQTPGSVKAQDFYSYKKKMLANHWVGYIPYAWCLVEKFQEQKIKQVIVTNGSIQELKEQLEDAPFKDFDDLLTASNFNPKPDIQMFEYAMHKFNAKPEEVLFIGDSKTDALAAQAMDLKFCHVDNSMLSYFKVAQEYGFVL